MTAAPLHEHLRQLGRRLLIVGAAAGLGWAFTTAIVVVLLAAWVDLFWELTPLMRVADLALAGMAGLVALGTVVSWAVRGQAATSLARRLDNAGGAAGEIRSGVDLMLDQRPVSILTRGLADLAVNRAAALAAGIAGQRAIPARPAAWGFSGAVGLLVGIALIGLVAPRLVRTQMLRFVDPYGDHPPYSRIQFLVDPGDVEVIYGRGFDVRVTTEGGAVDRLNLLLMATNGAQETVPMFPEADGAWRATVASVTTPGRYFVRGRDGRSAGYRLDVLTTPAIESTRFRIVPPAYTHLPAYEGPLPPGGIAGLPGTRVEVVAKSNRPLSGGTIEFLGDTVAMTATDVEARGGFVIQKAGSMTLTVVDVDRQVSDVPFTAAITLLVDQRPFIRLMEPPALSYASPEAVVPVAVAAEDDYGIARVQLFRSLNDSRGLPLDLPLAASQPTRWAETIQLPLSTFGLQPGDEIKLFARVEDNDPAGPKAAESTVAMIRIIPQSEFDRMIQVQRGLELMRSKYQAAQRRMESLAEEVDRLSKKAKEEPDKQAEVKDELKKLADRMTTEAEAIKKLAEHKLDYDLDEALTPHLERLTRELESAADEARKGAANESLTREEMAKLLEKLKVKLDHEQQQTKKDTVVPLESLALVMPLMEDSSRFVILVQKQRGLADRSKSLDGKDRPDDSSAKSRLRDWQEEQQRLKNMLGRILDDIEEHAGKLPDQEDFAELKETARKFVEEVRSSGADESMAEAEQGFGEFSGKRGHAGAKKAADILEEFMSQCDGMSGQCKGCLKFKVGIGNSLGDTLEQLLADAGLLPGQGSGRGAGSGGSGSSARRDALENVGMYGTMPSALQQSASRSGDSFGKPAAGVLSPRSDKNAMPGKPKPGVNPGTVAGAVEGLIPAPYRKRVAEYFQRITDETGGKP